MGKKIGIFELLKGWKTTTPHIHSIQLSAVYRMYIILVYLNIFIILSKNTK